MSAAREGRPRSRPGLWPPRTALTSRSSLGPGQLVELGPGGRAEGPAPGSLWGRRRRQRRQQAVARPARVDGVPGRPPRGRPTGSGQQEGEGPPGRDDQQADPALRAGSRPAWPGTLLAATPTVRASPASRPGPGPAAAGPRPTCVAEQRLRPRTRPGRPLVAVASGSTSGVMLWKIATSPWREGPPVGESEVERDGHRLGAQAAGLSRPSAWRLQAASNALSRLIEAEVIPPAPARSRRPAAGSPAGTGPWCTSTLA